VDWSEQIVLITGGRYTYQIAFFFSWKLQGAHGIGELLANTLAVRNVTVVVLDLEPIVTENCAFLPQSLFYFPQQAILILR
jgi:hypothetical protein